MAETNIRRLNQLLKAYECNHTYNVLVEDLASTLSSSRRNVALIVKRLVALGWIEWRPAVGRGQTSVLKVRTSIDDALYQTMVEELREERFSLISKLIEQYRETAVKALTRAMGLTCF
ncbi:SgrR family transcriptional regulator [Vibrio hepatarius]|uniref:SgrR family transcriptional regulator n=1 Tax=Vibrio hepatarius TaxID=171383 RepID=UPI001C0983D8|nr:SgrR family transcriptional regulator [Vibrio hepatarius]MBU2897456.1 SgrR family transcriptional regulator [Vibrio hepatarius]